jgi:hypothetical protein
MAKTELPAQIPLVIDIKQMRPACVLLQAVFGGDSGTLNRYFDAEDWIINPTPDMRRINGTAAQWEAFAKKHSVLGKLKRVRK